MNMEIVITVRSYRSEYITVDELLKEAPERNYGDGRTSGTTTATTS